MSEYWNNPPEPIEPPDCCGEPMEEFDGGLLLRCAHCGREILVEPDVGDPEPEIPDYISELPESSICPHGNKHGDCNACDVVGDLAYDAARERRYFQR